MALSVEKILADAHTLILHLKDHDCLADSIIASNQALFNKVEAMKQYQDDITELNEIAKHRPRSTLVLGIAQENRQIRELQQENRELQATLEEHQSALELIMQKYREHTVKLLQSNRLERALHDKDAPDKDSMCHLMDKIDEMAGVMQKAIEVDESTGCVDKERQSRLEMENRNLREMLEICSTSRDRIIVPLEEPPVKEDSPSVVESQGGSADSLGDEEDDDDDDTDTECDTSLVAAPVKEVVEEKEEKKEVEKKEEKAPVVGVKKKAQSTSSAPSSAKGGKSPSPSKSLVDIKKTKSSPVSRSVSDATVRKSSNTLTKKDSGTLKKTFSTDAKKDLKGKTTTGKTSTAKK